MTSTAQRLPGLIEEGEAFHRLAIKEHAHSRFHVCVAIAFLVAAFIGFAPSYYLKAFTDAPPVTPLRHVHGLAFTAWLLLLFTQSALVKARRVAVHMTLGLFGVALAATMVPLGVLMSIASAREALAKGQGDPLFVMVFQLGAMLMFGGFVGAALWVRKKNSEWHRRLMILATVSIIPAAIARWPIVDRNAPLAQGIAMLFIVAGIVHDRRYRGRVHAAYLVGAPIIALSAPARAAIGHSDAWHTFARFLVESCGG